MKWIFKTKFNADGSIQKHKIRPVTKGYSQQFGMDYNETFTPLSRQDTLRVILALTAQKKMKDLSTWCEFRHSQWISSRRNLCWATPRVRDQEKRRQNFKVEKGVIKS